MDTTLTARYVLHAQICFSSYLSVAALGVVVASDAMKPDKSSLSSSSSSDSSPDPEPSLSAASSTKTL